MTARRRAAEPVPASSLAAFRIAFGLLALVGAVRFLAKGWVGRLYLEPAHHLTYPGFDWVRPLPGPLAYAHVAALAILGLAIAVGYRHRIAAALFFLAFTYAELIDASLYLNHYWFISLVALLLVFLPADRRWSLDARAGRVASPGWVPRGAIWVVRTQLGVVYVFAGLAKLNGDWLREGLPLALWLPNHADAPLVGPLLGLFSVALAASWVGALFDLTIVGWLSWSRTRPSAYAVVVVFHGITAMLFPIGMFPWIMIASTLIFFDEDWPDRVLRRLGRPSLVATRPSDVGRGIASRLVVAAALVALVIQIAVPLRHLAYPGNVRFTEEGYYLSWRVMLTEKAGVVDFDVTDPASGQRWRVGPDIVLETWQVQQAAIRPDLLQATAHLVADDFARRGVPDVEVRADAWVSFNGRAPQRLVDPDVDLAARGRGIGHQRWILPLDPAVRD